MAGKVEAAVAQAQNFAPQPVSGGGQTPAGVTAGSMSAGNAGQMDAELAGNLQKLSQALGDYSLSHEHYMDEKGLNEAQTMIKGSSTDALKKLDVVDMAQTKGLLHASDNPYFQAYANNLRGSFLAATMKQDYDKEHEFLPAASADEERQRWQEYQAKWKEDNVTGNVTEAFDKGYNDTNLTNEKLLVDSWQQKDFQNQTAVVMAGTQSKLGAIVANAQELVKTPNALTNALNTAMAEPRLMGLPMANRMQLIDNALQQAAKTGHMTKDIIDRMLPNINLGFDEGGSKVTAADVVNQQTLNSEASAWRSQFLTKEKTDFVANFVKNKNLAGAQAAIEGFRKSDPEKAAEFAPLVAQVDSGIKAVKAAEERQRLALLKKQTKQFNSEVMVRTQLKAWINGEIGTSTQVLNGMAGADEETKNSVFTESYNYYLNSDMSGSAKMQYINKLMTCPGFDTYRRNIASQVESAMRNVRPGNTDSATAAQLLEMRRADPANFAAVYGNKVDSQVGALSQLIELKGSDEEGFKAFGAYNELDDDTKNQYKESVKSTLNSSQFTLDGVPSLGGGQGAAPIRYDSSPEIMTKIELGASVLMATGNMSAQDAVIRAAGQLVDSHAYYHGGLIPRGAYANMGTSDNEANFQKALDSECYKYAEAYLGGTGNADKVDCKYDDESRTFIFTDDTGQDTMRVSLTDIRDNAKGYESTNAESNNTDMDSSQAGSEVTGTGANVQAGSGLHAPM